ncbi:MAG: hypothetical protein OEU92_19905 [Alphaproteobacteria bacterium]|nr:hypothetical protein [Alphaproteobacteria bacterium]
MDGTRTRLKINLSAGEFEVEGSEAFVERYAERIDALFAGLAGSGSAEPVLPTPATVTLNANSSNGAAIQGSAPAHIGEWLEHMPRSATDVDRMLLSGYFAQLRSGDQSFGTGEANALLTDQGIKVGNPSQCVKQNLVAKRVFKHQRRYRVSQTGLEQLRQLLGPIFE